MLRQLPLHRGAFFSVPAAFASIYHALALPPSGRGVPRCARISYAETAERCLPCAGGGGCPQGQSEGVYGSNFVGDYRTMAFAISAAYTPSVKPGGSTAPPIQGSLFSVPLDSASIYHAQSSHPGGRGVPRPYTSETILPAVPYRLELIFAVISRRLFWILLSPFFRAISTFRMAYRMVVWSRLNSLPMSGRLRFVIFRMR